MCSGWSNFNSSGRNITPGLSFKSQMKISVEIVLSFQTGRRIFAELRIIKEVISMTTTIHDNNNNNTNTNHDADDNHNEASTVMLAKKIIILKLAKYITATNKQ